MKLLVVEDEALLRHHLQTRLTESGHVVEAVANAEEALYQTGQFNFDLAVIDLGLPGMGGLDLIRQAELRAGERRFGLAAHLYSLRRRGDQGLGDFTTLALLGEATARAGGSIVGINPLHALFGEDRERASPYHPSDRRFLDPIYVDVAAVPEVAAAGGDRIAHFA